MARLITGSDALTAEEVQARIDAQIAEGASSWDDITGKPTSLEGAGITDLAHPWVTPQTGEWVVTTIGGGDTLATSNRVVNALEMFQFVPQGRLALSAVAISISSTVAGALGRVLLYDTDVHGRPGAKLYQSADLDCSTPGVKQDTCALTLERGRRLWLATWFSSSSLIAHVWATSALPDINGGSAPSTSGRKLLRRTVAFANAAPDPWTWSPSEITSARPAAIWLGI